MFGVDAAEAVLLIVLAVVLFGPEKLPTLARKAARVIVYLRAIANNAQTQLKSELGPEFADLTVQDLNPKALVRKHLSAEIEAIEEAKRDLSSVKTTIKDATTLAAAEVAAADGALKTAPALETAPRATPFDIEAT